MCSTEIRSKLLNQPGVGKAAGSYKGDGLVEQGMTRSALTAYRRRKAATLPEAPVLGVIDETGATA
jgi:hypothetical protein